MIIILYSFSKFYTSFFREHKPLRLYTNPTFYIYSSFKYLNTTLSNKNQKMKILTSNAKIIKTNNKKRVVILVIGEAVRANRLSFNGYKRETTPF
jgi:lipid A ethanolaminephosphotransferase